MDKCCNITFLRILPNILFYIDTLINRVVVIKDLGPILMTSWFSILISCVFDRIYWFSHYELGWFPAQIFLWYPSDHCDQKPCGLGRDEHSKYFNIFIRALDSPDMLVRNDCSTVTFILCYASIHQNHSFFTSLYRLPRNYHSVIYLIHLLRSCWFKTETHCLYHLVILYVLRTVLFLFLT